MSTVKMVAKCGKCGGEFVDGTVFCEHCGERIMVGVPDGFEDGRPFYAYQWMGETHLLSSFGWALRWFVVQLFVVLAVVVMAADAGEDGLPLLLAAALLGSAYFLAWFVLIRRYRSRGSPTDFGGGGPPTRP
ncbi:MAG: hypothetical protein AB1793_07465 [Candidatus Thermoplasmatota archaeon]